MASILADRVRVDVLSGALSPGSRLTVKELAERYESGTIPLREALSRLTMTGFVKAEDRKGFRVAEISAADAWDITTLRAELECIALKDSIANATTEWEGAAIAAHRALMRIEESHKGRPLTLAAGWEEKHSQFHLKLVGGCQSKWLMSFIEILIEHSVRYRQIGSFALAASSSTRDVSAEHKAILDATLARDSELACALLKAHYRETAKIIAEGIETLLRGDITID